MQTTSSKCKICKRSFESKGSRPRIYCSKKCYLVDHPVRVLICKVCKKEVRIKEKISDRLYCSRRCMYKDPDWVGKQKKQFPSLKQREAISKRMTGRFLGKKNPNYKHGFFSKRRQIKAKANGICMLCKTGIEGETRFLDLHHMDKHRENNSMSNLLAICPNCHRKEHLKK